MRESHGEEEAWQQNKKAKLTQCVFFVCLKIVVIVFQHTVVHRKAKMPEDLAQMQLMDTGASGAPAPEEPGKVGAVSLDNLDELKDNLKVFTDSVHQKASQVISWIQAVEPHQTDLSKKCLVLKNWFQHGFNVFSK